MSIVAFSIVSSNGNSGSIEVRIKESIAASDVSYSLGVIVDIQNSDFRFTDATPSESATFDTNGVRWSDVRLRPGATAKLFHRWTGGAGRSTPYVVVIVGRELSMKKGDRPRRCLLHVHYGSIPGQAADTFERQVLDRILEIDPERFTELLERVKVRLPPQPKPDTAGRGERGR